ncbi:MAG: DUF4256 domain-containing protein [Bacteroidia bacterium]
MTAKVSKKLNSKDSEAIKQILKSRFEKNMKRHKDVDWKKVESKLDKNPDKLWSLNEMEKSGGEPDVIGIDKKTGEIIFCDCAAESPKVRASLCYDKDAWNKRKEHKPKSNAIDMATSMGITIMTEEEYHAFQKLGPFDQKTSSWLLSPPEIRKLGGAIFGDFRFGRVFIYHNTAESYYGSRGFRGILKV